MLNSLTNKAKFVSFLAAIVLLLILGYNLSIRKTLDLYKENNTLSSLTMEGEPQLMRKIAVRTGEKRKIDSVLSKINEEGASTALVNQLFDRANRYNVRVRALSENKPDSEGGSTTYALQMEGFYINFVKYLRSIERDIYGAKVESVIIYIEVDRRTKSEYLLMDVVLTKLKNGI